MTPETYNSDDLYDQQTILIIEDNQYDYLLIKHIILSFYPDINILYAESLGDAYKIYKNNRYDFVVLDLNLPDGYGVGTLQEVKKFHGHTPIITLSGDMSETTKQSAKRLGAAAALSKDILDKPEFMDVITTAVMNARQLDGNYCLDLVDQVAERQALLTNHTRQRDA